MQTFDQNARYSAFEEIRNSIESNTRCADQLVSETIKMVTQICHEWALSKFQHMQQLIETSSMNKKRVKEALSLFITSADLEQIWYQITKALQTHFEEHTISFPAGMAPFDTAWNYKRSEKYLLELSRAALSLELAEEVKQSCCSMAFGDFKGWLLANTVSDSGNHYNLQQSKLQALLFQQINGILYLIEQRLTRHLLDHIIPDTYRQFDQREQYLRQSLQPLPHTDLYAGEILHQAG
ncbi:MAG: hypothetical protein VB084_09410 [Syntrophomonadaceae bacterium]|nr:hypothetical protein [Syntrophomonadaceae bacterium]